MTTWHRHREPIAIAGLVAALHLALCWLLLSERARMTVQRRSLDLDVVFLQLLSQPKQIRSVNAGPTVPRASPNYAAKTAIKPRATPIPTSGGHSISRPIDWNRELHLESKASNSHLPSAPARDFGFPHTAVTPAPKTLRFGWDHARTHRAESIPGGGLLINLNDRCVIAFTPLPFPFCGIGKIEANGDLFRNMHDRPNADDRNLP